MGRHNKVPSSQSDTRSCRWFPFASKFPRSYRARSRTNGPNSERCKHTVSTWVYFSQFKYDLLFKRSKEVQKAGLKMEFKLNFNSPSSYLTIESGVSMWAGALVGAVAVVAGAAVQAGF